MDADAFGVVGAATAGDEIGGIGGESNINRGRLAAVGVLGPCELACPLSCLPMIKDVDAVGRLEVVGDANAFEPRAATAKHAPGARRSCGAAIGEPDAHRDAV